VKDLTRKVLEYDRLLRYMGLRDHQVEHADRPAWKSLAILCYRVGLISVWTLFALPGVILNAPIFIAGKVISRKKAKGKASFFFPLRSIIHSRWGE
jgi:glycerol-3-phosphate O-acyltransferase/dihydroxyacetone phosphate acyltransferase